jgi:hypothetical protein
VLNATVTVPRGRTLKLRSGGTITFVGDLWVQRGGTLVLECTKFSMQSPPGTIGEGDMWTPSGRVFLEEGASIICSGDIEIPGSSKWGSVIVGGTPGQIHPITTAIYGKNINLTNGVFSGSALDDLVGAIGKEAPVLNDLNNKLLRPLLADIAPNAAKAGGPFFARKPYFASYCSTVALIFLPILFGAPTVPVITPLPIPRDNVLVPIARALGIVYAITLNVSVGENFMTHTDWWVFGEGVVPWVPQVSPGDAVSKIAAFPGAALDALDPGTLLTNFLEAVVTGLIAYVAVEVITKVVEEVALKIIPYGGLAGILTSLLPDIGQALTGKEDVASKAGNDLIGSLTDSVKDASKQTLAQLQSIADVDQHDIFLREYNGVLVYGSTIKIGGKNASGMFVADKDINITSARTVGTLLSLEGNITCTSLLFYPYFNRASLYVPKSTPDGWLGRAMEFNYDEAFSSNTGIDVGPPAIPQRVAAEGWSK